MPDCLRRHLGDRKIAANRNPGANNAVSVVATDTDNGGRGAGAGAGAEKFADEEPDLDDPDFLLQTLSVSNLAGEFKGASSGNAAGGNGNQNQNKIRASMSIDSSSAGGAPGSPGGLLGLHGTLNNNVFCLLESMFLRPKNMDSKGKTRLFRVPCGHLRGQQCERGAAGERQCR